MSKDTFKMIVDIVFAVDTTSSMGTFVNFAKAHMAKILEKLVESGVDLKCGLVEYRDHPPEESSFVYRVHKFGKKETMGSHVEVSTQIARLSVDGGGDTPEAVYDGVWAAATIPDWRANAHRKIILLVGDAPPHGACEHGDTSRSMGRWPKKTPSGIGLHECTAAAEEKSISVYAACMTADKGTLAEFEKIAGMTGGSAYGQYGGASSSPVDKIILDLVEMSKEAILVKELMRQGVLEPEAIAEKLGFRISRVNELISVLDV
jgi:hypothetical protein